MAPHEEAEELDLVRVAVDSHQHPAAGLDDARHLADAFRHVGKQHDAELRSGHVEAVVVEFERVAVHDAGLDRRAPPCAHAPSSSSSMTGDWSVARTCAPRRAAGMLSAPLPAATSRNRMPERSPARRRPSLPSHICVGVLVRS